MNTPQKPQSLVIALGVLLVCLAGISIYQYLATAATARTLHEQRTALEDAQKQAVALVNAEADEKQLAVKISRHPATWSWTEQLPVMVSQLTGLVQGCGTPIDTLQPSQTVVHGQFARFPLHLTMHMDLAHLTIFMQRAQQAMPVLAVDQMTIRAGKRTGELLQIDLTLSSYVMLEDSQQSGGRS